VNLGFQTAGRLINLCPVGDWILRGFGGVRMTQQPSDSSLSAYEEAALDRQGATTGAPARQETVENVDALSDDVLPYSFAYGS
jgi:hypothetical protein